MGLLFGTPQDDRRRTLAEAIVATQYNSKPTLVQRYGPTGRQKCVEDVTYTLLYLEAAMASASPELFRDYVAWVRALFERLGIDLEDLADSLTAMRVVVQGSDSLGTAAVACIDDALASLRHQPAAGAGSAAADDGLDGLARRYLETLLSGDRRAASELVTQAVADGVSLPVLYLDVFQPSLREVGRLWQGNVISVAQEHLFTAATQLIMSRFYAQIFDRPGNGHSMVAVCANGELHEIGIRMVADLFEMDGWDTVYVGASTPLSSTVALLAERRPELLALSVTIAPNVVQARDLIAAVRREPACRGVRILVGGYPFNQVPELWRRIGADGWAPDARQAVAVGRALVDGDVAA